jgi:hypothetical protein
MNDPSLPDLYGGDPLNELGVRAIAALVSGDRTGAR